MAIPKIKLTRKPMNYHSWPWSSPKLDHGFPVTELDELDDLTKTLAIKLLGHALERNEAVVLWGVHQLEILNQAEEWLGLRPVSPSEAWSHHITFHNKDSHWWGTDVLNNWRIRFFEWPTQFNLEELSWLTAWEFTGKAKEASDIWGELMHGETNRYRENNLQDYPRPQFDEVFYSYEGAKIALPSSQKINWPDFESILQKRESKIHSKNKLTLTQLSQLLENCFKITQNSLEKRSYPAAGGIYETHILIEVRNVRDLDSGFYAYHPISHELIKIGKARTCEGSATILFVSDNCQLEKKYKTLSYRLALMNTGVLYHYLGLMLTALGLQGHAWGATSEGEWRRLISSAWKSKWKILGSYEIEGPHE